MTRWLFFLVACSGRNFFSASYFSFMVFFLLFSLPHFFTSSVPPLWRPLSDRLPALSCPDAPHHLARRMEPMSTGDTQKIQKYFRSRRRFRSSGSSISGCLAPNRRPIKTQSPGKKTCPGICPWQKCQESTHQSLSADDFFFFKKITAIGWTALTRFMKRGTFFPGDEQFCVSPEEK